MMKKTQKYILYLRFLRLWASLFYVGTNVFSKMANYCLSQRREALFTISNQEFIAREDDIYIVAYPRSGTTWLQMILYQLTSSGEMNFTHISEKIPFIEREFKRGHNMNNMPSPRIFKSDSDCEFHKNKPGNFIYIERNGESVLKSYYYFSITNMRSKDTFNTFFKKFMSGDVPYGSWFSNVRDWRAASMHCRMLHLRYEELCADRESVIRKIVEFCGFEPTEETIMRAVEYSSFEYMKQHEMIFDQHIEYMWERGVSFGNFIRKGPEGKGDPFLSDDQSKDFNERIRSCGL